MIATIASASSPGLLQALGLNWQLFIEQGLAFVVLVWVLGKFVYPALVKSIDDRRAMIEAGLQEAKQSQEALEKAEVKVEQALADARKEADDIVARTHQEAALMIAEAEAKAKQRAEQIVKDAHTQLEADIAKARAALKQDTIELVALATERIVHEKIDTRKDAHLIKEALEPEAR